MINFTQEIKRLQKLACISLSLEEEERFSRQIPNIIGFLDSIPTVETDDSKIEKQLTLRTYSGIKNDVESKKILKNVKHKVVNNSIVIKSALS